VSGRLAEELTRAVRDLSPLVTGADETLDGGGVDALASRVAAALARRGARPWEPVHVEIGNRPSDLGALLGIWRAGTVAVPVHVSTPPPVLETLRATTKARFSIRGEAVEAIGERPPPERPLLRDAALIVFTSGSTGRPKGVAIGHERLAGKLEVLARLLSPRPGEVVLCPLQLTFIFGIWVSLLTLLAGARLRLMPKFAPDAVWRTLAEDGTVLAAVPTMLRTLAAGGPAPAVRAVLTGGEPLDPALAAALRTALPGAGLYDLYGLTETGSCDLCLLPADQPDGLGAIGRPTENVAFRIVAEDGSAAAEGSPGELRIRTPYGMLGYLDDPGLTASSFSDGFFRTGDLARVRADGRVELVGRSKEMIVRRGNKISPLEIDRLFQSHPDVEAALSAGVPDLRLGETIHVVVVPREGAALDPQALSDWARDRIERYKLPDAVHVRGALPTGRTGKADRTAVARIGREAAR
jgi:acyl-CoA synthetase (AMP-forming)/AMP-acid ligase II